MATDTYKESVASMNTSYQLKGGTPTGVDQDFQMDLNNQNEQGSTGGDAKAGDFQQNSAYYGEDGDYEDFGEEEYYGDEFGMGDYNDDKADSRKGGGENKRPASNNRQDESVRQTQQTNYMENNFNAELRSEMKSNQSHGHQTSYMENNFNADLSSEMHPNQSQRVTESSSSEYKGSYSGDTNYKDSYQGDNYGSADYVYNEGQQYADAEQEQESYPNEDIGDSGDFPGDNEEEGEEEEVPEEEGSEEEEDSDYEESEDEALNALGDLDNLLGEGEEEEAEEDPGSMEMEPSSSTANEEPQPPDPDDVQKKKRKRRKKGAVGEDGEKPKRKRKKKGEADNEDKETEADKKAKHARKNIRKILSENKLEKETLDAQQAELERQKRLQELKKQQMGLLQMTAEKEIKKEKDSQLKSLLQVAEEDAEKQEIKKEEKKEADKETPKKKEGIIDISSAEDEDEDCVMVQSEEEEEDLSDEEYAEAEDVNNSGSHINDEYNRPDDKGRVLVNVGHPTADPDIFLSPLVGNYIKPHQIGGVRFLYDNLVECINRFKTSSGFGCILAHSMGLGKTIQMVGFTDIFLRHTGARTVMVIVPINTLANWMSEFNMWTPDEKICKEQNYPEEITPRPYSVYLLNDSYKNTPSRAKVIEEWYKTGGVLLLGYEMYRLLSSKKVHLQKAPRRRKTANSSEVIDVEEEDRDKKLLMGMHEALVNPGPDLVVCDEGHRIKNSHAGISQSLKQIKTKRRIVLTGYPLQNNMIEYWCMVDFVRPNFLGTKTEFCNMFERPIMNGQCADSTPQDVRLMRYRAHVLHSLLEGFVQRRGHTVLQAALPPKREYVCLIRMSPIQKALYQKFMESISDSGQNGWVNNNPLKAFSVCCKVWNHPDILYTCMKKSLDDNDLDIETGEPKKKGRARPKKETPPATPVPPAMPQTDSSGSQPQMPGQNPMQMPGQMPMQGQGQMPMPGQLPMQGQMPMQGQGQMSMQGQGQMSMQGQGQIPGQTPMQTSVQPSNQTPSQTPSGTPNPTPSTTPTPTANQLPGTILGSGSTASSSLFSRSSEPSITYDWANEVMKDYVPGMLENGGKMLLLFKLIQHSLAEGDKLLVFSQSLFTLNLIEEFLGKYKVPRPEVDEYWCKNKNYFRLDGSTASSEREKLINQFNYDPNKWVFLLSTRAGSLGVNLVGANRVVVMDASWNPCHDCQAICRVYRFGQVKPSYIYRFVTENTMEKKIYDRQVNKQGMSDRVVDELNPQNQFRKEQVDKLLVHETKEYPMIDFSNCENEHTDPAMIEMLKHQGHWLTAKPFTHESLLIDRKELKLTMKEKRLAKQSYVMEKRLNVSYSRPSYAAYYPRGRGGNRPIASVKPMVSTPVPMRPKIVAAPQILKPGVSVHQVLTTTEIVLPGTNTATEAGATQPKKIPAGQQVLVIRTPKGVYIRTPDGKIFAVRSKPQPNSTSPLDTLANTGSNLTVSTASGGSRAVTIVRPNLTATTSTASVSLRNPSGVTVIRPATASSGTKPLTIIRQGPGPVRTIIPVTLSTKAGTTTTSGATTTTAQAQKVNMAIQNGAQIRIVTATSDGKQSVSSLAALQNLSEGKKIISNSPAFSGGSLIVKTNTQKSGIQTVKKLTTNVSASNDSDSNSNSAKSESDKESNTPMDTSDKQDNTDLKPIDLKALQLPQQLSGENKDFKNSDSMSAQFSSARNNPTSKSAQSQSSQSRKSRGRNTKVSSNSNRPVFSLTSSPSNSNLSEPSQSDSQSPKFSMPSSIIQQRPISSVTSSPLSTRPSDIDLHELQLSGNTTIAQNTVKPQQQAIPSTFSQQTNQSSTNQQSGGMNVQQNMPAQNMGTNSLSGMGNLVNNLGNNVSSVNNNMAGMQGGNMSNLQQQQQVNMSQPTNRGFFNPGLPSTPLKPTMSDPGHMSTQAQSGFMGNNNMMNNNLSGSGFMGMLEGNNTFGSGSAQSNISGQSNMAAGQSNMSGQTNMTGNNQNSNNDFLSEFNSIQNNSSFLSELNFTEADDSFLSQLGESSNQSSQSSNMSNQGGQMNQPGVMNNFGNNSGSMPNFQTPSMGMQGFQPQQPQQQSGFNFDMFSNPQQQTQQQNTGFFPNFSNQFPGNTGGYGNNQAMGMSQPGGFPGGSMYPMGGMMQPGMYGYPAFPAYPYPPMMPPMPYYPMPFQPQYGTQGNTMGQQPGNVTSQGSMGLSGQQGNNSFQSGTGNSS